MENGVTQTAVGNGIWTRANIEAQGNITAGTTSSRIYMNDTDESTTAAKSLHANSNVIGFLNGAGTWTSYWDNGGNQTTPGGITAVGGYADGAGTRLDA